MNKTFRLPTKTSLLLSILLLLILNSMTYAAPMPPRPVINHQSRECAEIVPGGECGDVVLPPGWEYLDPDKGEQCPANYAFVELSPDWIHFKVSFCCTAGHSGASGDCEDVVVHQSDQQCAFVDDVRECASLPDGWEASGEDCPAEFEWVADVVCTGSDVDQELTPTVLPRTELASTLQPAVTPSPIPTEPTIPVDARNPLCPCASLGLALVALLSLRFLRR